MYVLSDTGIQQAETLGLIRWSTPPDMTQRQPMSIDLRFQAFDDVGFFDGRSSFPPQGVLPSRSQGIALATQGMELAQGMTVSADLRSSLRRLACYASTGAVMRLENRVAIEMTSHSCLDIQIPVNERFAQVVFRFDKNEDACYWEAGIAHDARSQKGHETYEQLLTCDHGHEVLTRTELRSIVKDGYLIVEPMPVLQKRLLRVHAGNTARVLRTKAHIRFGESNIADLFETVDLPYRLQPGEHAVVDTRERLTLSPHVGLLFYDYLLGTGRGMEFWRRTEARTREILSCIPDGLIDPGYNGTFSRQPKTPFLDGTVLEPGMPLGHAMVIFFPDGVMRSYGSVGLGSHYQGQTATIITPK